MAFGETLKQKRLEHGWTKEYVAERTHMMVRTIDALETETLKRIPAPIYGRGFIKQYATLLGIEPQPLIDDYMSAVSGNRTSSPVTQPTIHGLPSRPPEPILTGARRTLPPKPTPPSATPAPTHHKLVEPAEATFTAVPKPEVLVPPTAPEPEPEQLVLDGGLLPEPPPQKTPTPPPPTPPLTGRATLATPPAPTTKHRRDVTPVKDPPRPTTHASGSIFGPQHPVPDPPNPHMRSLATLFAGIGRWIRSTIRFTTHPHVQRMGDQPEPVLTRRLLLQALFIFLALLGITLLVLAFRYVFRASADAESEHTPTPAAQSGKPFELRPVADPPEPYFK